MRTKDGKVRRRQEAVEVRQANNDVTNISHTWCRRVRTHNKGGVETPLPAQQGQGRPPFARVLHPLNSRERHFNYTRRAAALPSPPLRPRSPSASYKIRRHPLPSTGSTFFSKTFGERHKRAQHSFRKVIAEQWPGGGRRQQKQRKHFPLRSRYWNSRSGWGNLLCHREKKKTCLICLRVMAPAASACSVATSWSELPIPSDTWFL